MRLRFTPRQSIATAHLRRVSSSDLAEAVRGRRATEDWSEWESRLTSHPMIGGLEEASGVSDRRALFHLVRAYGARVILEIGTHAGASTAYLAAAVGNGGRLVTVDPEPVNDPELGPWRKVGVPLSPREMVDYIAPGATATFVQNTSLAYLASTSDEFDFAFVDGDHSGRTVYREIAALSARMAPNGLIALHDYYPPLATHAAGSLIRGPYHAVQRALGENHDLVVHLVPTPGPVPRQDAQSCLVLLARR